MLNFKNTPEQEALAKEWHEFFAGEVTEEKWDRTMDEQQCNNPYWHDLHLKMAEKHYHGLMAPKEYGGMGVSFTSWTIFLEEVGKCRIPFGNVNAILNTSNFFLGCLLIAGTDEQKKLWIPKILSGEVKSCQGLTEPGAGSDLAGVELRAVEQPDGSFILNGTKIFNNAHSATHILNVTRTDTTVAKHKGISLFFVDLKSPGVSISPRYISCGAEKRSEVAFDDVHVPKDALIGQKNQGWRTIAQAMRYERTMGYRVGESNEDFERLLRAVKDLKFDGQPVAKIPWVRYKLAEIATELLVVRLMCYRVAYLQDHDIDVTNQEAPITKVIRSEIQERIGNAAIEILGEYGGLEKWAGTRDNVPVRGAAAEWYQDSRKEEIGAGTTEVQFNIVGIRGLGLPNK